MISGHVARFKNFVVQDPNLRTPFTDIPMVSVMTALRMVRRGIIKGRQLCRGAPWVIKVEDMAAYR